jgi:hypothetical protein
VHLQTNVVVISPRSDQQVALAEIPAAVGRAGFVPDEMRIRARGTYESNAGVREFRIRGWRDTFRVETEARELSAAEIEISARVKYLEGDIVLVSISN